MENNREANLESAAESCERMTPWFSDPEYRKNSIKSFMRTYAERVRAECAKEALRAYTFTDASERKPSTIAEAVRNMPLP